MFLIAASAWAAPSKIRLSPKDVAELVLKQGPATDQVNNSYLTTRFAPAESLLPYDWKATFESGYENDQLESIDRANLLGTTYKSYVTTLALEKAFTTGSKFMVNYSQRSRDAEYSVMAPPAEDGAGTNQIPKAGEGLLGVTLEQSLLKNAFGRADRATVRAAQKTFAAAGVQRLDNLENVVLSALSQFWNTYVAEETFREAIASRERFKNLVAQVRRKNSVGYANPGELAQAQADYEAQEQSVKTASITYLASMDVLLTNLNLPAGSEIEFVVAQNVPPVPKLPKVNVEELRSIRNGKLELEAAQDSLTAAQSKRYPEVALVGRYYTSGYDENVDGAFSRLSSTKHPKYYIGGKLSYNFGSDYQSEDILNKKAQRDLKQTALALQTANSLNALVQEERNVESSYAILQSAFRQKEYREKAVQELTRTYSQGRTDVKVLIDAINNQFDTKVKLARALGDYQIALNKWAASRDELIPDTSSPSPGSATSKEEEPWTK